MPYEFEKQLPKSEAHNMQHVEDKLRQEWIHDPYSLAHESKSLSLNANKVEANRDKAVFRQMQSESSMKFGNLPDGVVFLQESNQAIDAIRKQDPTNIDLPQLDLIQKRLERAGGMSTDYPGDVITESAEENQRSVAHLPKTKNNRTGGVVHSTKKTIVPTSEHQF